MPKFKSGDPQITFVRKDGKKFTKTFHSKSAANNAWKGWKSAGGKVASPGFLRKSKPKYKKGSGWSFSSAQKAGRTRAMKRRG